MTRPDGTPPPAGSVAAWTTGSIGSEATAPSAERYARGGELGRGGMGVVEAAHDTWLGRSVAVKRPHGADVQGQLGRLVREARITAGLLHSAIPPIYDVGEDELGPYYTMPVLTGTTLHARLESPPVAERALVTALVTACRAVGYAHARGVVHRDLKPANLLLGAHGEVWVLDWGVALDPLDPDDGRVGTDGFRAPEVDAGRRATPRSDVFALGKILSVIVEASRDTAPELRAVAARASAHASAARYADGTALADELSRWLDGHLVEAHDYPIGEVVRHLVWRWRAPLAVAAVAALALAGGGLGALEAQRSERVRADRSLAVTLAQQADALRASGARPESEVLAAQALALDDSPLARGVLAAWAVEPPLSRVTTRPLPCASPFVEPDGYMVCADAALTVGSPTGERLLHTPLPALPDDAAWIGEVAEARRYPDGTVLLRRTSNHVEVWHAGARTAWFDLDGQLRLADGPVPAVHDARRIGVVDPQTGAVRWGPPTCDAVEAALVRDDVLVVACRDPFVFVGTLDAPGDPVAVAGHPAVVAWSDGPVLGTFEGHVVHRTDQGWHAVDAKLGAVRQLAHVAPGLVLVRGEHRDARLWSLTAGAPVGSFPRGVSSIAASGGAPITTSDAVHTWAVPETPRVTVLDRSAEGGVSTLGVSPSGDRVVIGSATGEIAVWDVVRGVATRLVSPQPATAKAVAVLDEQRFLHAHGSRIVERSVTDGAELGPEWPLARVVRADGARFALLPWSARMTLVDPHGPRELQLPAPPVGVVFGPQVWIADDHGGVHEVTEAGPALRFALPSPTMDLAAAGPLLVATDGAAVVAYTTEGGEQWRRPVPALVTAMAASSRWVVAGDVDGRVFVLRPDGALVAGLSGHTRRVSAVSLRGDTLITASWDGTVRLWGLTVLDVPADQLRDAATSRWRLTREQALAGADPLGLGG